MGKNGSAQRHRRPVGVASVKPVVYVACEGISEWKYLQALAHFRYDRAIVINRVGAGGSRRGNRTSVAGLVADLRKFERKPDSGYRPCDALWLVCDADPQSNASHTAMLEEWLVVENHHAAIQSSSLEGWLVTHLTDTRPYPPKVALKELTRLLPDYRKGGPIPKTVIAQTDVACRRERAYAAQFDYSGVWPPERCAQMPALIAYLDELASQVGWKPES